MTDMSKGAMFQPGDTVFARWHGSTEFLVVRRLDTHLPMPHWICKAWGGKKYEYWVFPGIQLSRKKIEHLIKEHNRKQLSLKFLR